MTKLQIDSIENTDSGGNLENGHMQIERKYNILKRRKIIMRRRDKINCIVPSLCTYFLLFCLFLCLCRGGTITGSISFTPTTIRTSATYTFSLTNSRILQAGETISILFPTSDYDFSSQTTTTLSKTCTPLAGMSATGITSCSLNKSTNALTILLGDVTTSLTISFTVATITNPLYSKTTSSFTISSITSTLTLIDISDNSFTVLATPGVLSVTLTSATYTVGAIETLKFTLACTNSIATSGKIVVILPKWNPESNSPVSIFNSGSPTCIAVTNISSITCTYTTNINGSSTQDKIVVTGAITVGATTIEFSISNYHNPPSTKPMTTMQVYTTTSVDTNIVDSDDTISLVMTQASTIASSSVTITPTDTVIQKSTTYTFSIKVSDPLPVGTVIKITFPSEISPSSSTLTATGTGKLNTMIVTSYDSSTRVCTLSEVIISQSSYVNDGETIQFSLSLITNPTYAVTSSSFSIKTMEGTSYLIESGITGFTVTATPGSITALTVSPINTKVRERTLYSFTITTEHSIPTGSVLTIIFPSEITVENRSGIVCISASVGISTSSLCTVADSKTLVITNGFSTAVSAGSTISFSVDSITNGNTVQPTSYFQVQFKNSNSYYIDIYKYTNMTLTFVINTLASFSINMASLYTGVETTYTFSLTSDISIGNLTKSASTCGSTSGFTGTITCLYSSSNTLKVTGGFASSFAGASARFSIGGIRNSRSTATTLSFKIYVYDSNGYGQYSIENGNGVTASSVSDFTAVSISRDSTINSAVTTYYFTITLSNVIVTGDYIKIVFPNEIALYNVVNQCLGVTNLSSPLVCSLQSNTFNILVSLLSGVTQLPTVAGDTTTNIKFSISNAVNPPSLTQTSSFQFYVLTNNQTNLINQRTSGVTISNTMAASFLSASAQPDVKDLGVTANYLISFQPANSIVQNTVVKVTIPSQIGIKSSSTPTCSAVLIIESTLTCSYDSATRIVTVSNGFVAKSSYVSSQVEFMINNLVNPNTGITTDSFIIQTMTSAGVLYNSISSGITYSRGCSSPCKTCETDVTVCTSCDATSNKPYLSNKNCIASCPYSQYTASNNTCVSCQSPCASCSNSQTYCLSCISNPQMYLLNNECVSNCPTNYSVGDDGGTCEKTGEFFVPFIGLFLFLVIIAVVSLVKLCNKTTLYFESVLAITPYLVIMLNIVIIVLLFRDSHYQSGSICIVAFCALITINFFWTFCYYRKEIRNDALYKVWREYYPKTEILLYFCNYVINFQCYRLGLCQLAGLKRFKGSIRSINKVNVQLNRYMIFQILFVYLPILCACVYNLFWTTQYRQVFWNDIEMIIVTTIIIVFICIDIYTNDDSAVRKDFASKEEFTQNIDITDKSMTKQTIYSTKEDLQTNRSLVDGSLPVYNKGADLQKNVNKQSVHFEKKSLNQKLIREQKEEEVNSEVSDNFKPNKKFNDLNPFQEKYDDITVTNKNSTNPQPTPTRSKIYEEIASSNTKQSNQVNRQLNNDDGVFMNDKSNTAFDVSNIDPGNRNGKIKLFKANNFEGHNRFGPSHQNGMNQANLFISKLNAPLETPALLLSKAKLELKQEIDKEEFLEHSQSSLNKEIKLLNSEIVKLERKKLKLKLAKHNDESVRLSEDSESDRGSEHRSQSSNSSRENARNKNNQLNSTIKTENAKRKESFGKTLTKNNLSKLSNQNKDEVNSKGSISSKHIKIGPEIQQNKPTSGFRNLGWSFDDGLSDDEKNPSAKPDKTQTSVKKSPNNKQRSRPSKNPKSKTKNKKKRRNNKSTDSKFINENHVSDLSIKDESKVSSPQFNMKGKIQRKVTNKPMESQIGNMKR